MAKKKPKADDDAQDDALAKAMDVLGDRILDDCPGVSGVINIAILRSGTVIQSTNLPPRAEARMLRFLADKLDPPSSVRTTNRLHN
jgi:hypothetical protein